MSGLDATDRAGDRAAWRNRVSSVGLVMVLLGVSVFALWSAQATADASQRAETTSKLAGHYDAAAGAVSVEQSLERLYQMKPQLGDAARFDAEAARLRVEMGGVQRDGDSADRSLARRVLALHTDYVSASEGLFRDISVGPATRRTDSAQINRTLRSIRHTVDGAATRQDAESLAALAQLQQLEVITSRLTPLVFLCGLLLAATFASIGRGYRRLLKVERVQAIHDSLHDDLTGLPNRTLLYERLSQAVSAARTDGTSVGLLLIDLDRFKEINDTFGHHYGDLLLRQVGPRLMSALGDEDTVARLGGDEFAVLLPRSAGARAAAVTANKVLETLSDPFEVEGVALDIEASLGFVTTGNSGDSASRMLQHADIAMYVAKAQNLGCLAYDSTINNHSPAKLALLGQLRRALDHGELVLHYQPKVSISTGDVVGVEGLVRWQHEKRGFVLPDEFIPLAEHTGLIGPLTRYVLNSALAQARIWIDAGRPVQVAVNLSARNLLDERLPSIVAELLAVHRVDAHLLELEITESALLTEPGRAQRLLERLAAVGVRISIDDFGAGYTSLGQLKDLPIRELKIDRSFVTTVLMSRSDALIVQSVIDLGHNLGMTIVAEGVEDAETLQALAGFGCDVAQGFFLSRPLSAQDFDQWYRARAIALAAVGDHDVPRLASGP